MRQSIYLSIIFLFGISLCTQAQDTTFWQQKYAPSWRHMLSTQVIADKTFVGVGGWYENDSITTVVVSTDAGKDFRKSQDNIGPILQDVHFPQDSIGYAVGWNGGFWKSTDWGENWTQQQIPGQAGSRHFNACYFLDNSTGYIAGGNPSNDSIRTILKTTDGGDSWSVQMDGLGAWLHDIEFTTTDLGIAVGENGTLLRTTDAGANWTDLNLAGNLSNRVFKAVSMANSSLGLAVGGWPSNDSVQTLLRTTDGGENWSVIYDNIGSMLHGVDFSTDSLAYVAGDDGVVLMSEDAGQNWTAFTISGIADAEFRSVRFRSKDQGIISGLYGMLLMYNDTTNRVAEILLDSSVHRTSETTAELSGIVSAKGYETELTVQYGENGQFDLSGLIDPQTISNMDVVPFDIKLSGLKPSTLYDVRVVAVSIHGTTYSNTVSFYSGGTPIPNYSFELWDRVTRTYLDDWNGNIGVTKVVSGDGSNAAQLSTVGTEPGLLIIGAVDNGQFLGGMPCAVMPDSLKLDLNYRISNGDSALILSYFKKAGVEIHTELFKIHGSSNGAFETKAFSYTYSGSETPDSVILAIVNTNALAGTRDDSSTLTIDNIEWIASQSIAIANHDFENWTDVDYNVLQSWTTTDRVEHEPNRFITQSTDAYKGNYAVKLTNDVGREYAQLSTGDKLSQGPDFAVERAYKALLIHLKWFPQDGDTLNATVNLYSEGENVGGGSLLFVDGISEYEEHIIPIEYWSALAVDSCQIEFVIRNNQNTAGSSYAIIDHLSFETFFSSVRAQTSDVLSIYPNPFESSFEVNWPASEQAMQLVVLDMAGRVVHRESLQNKNRTTIDASTWSAGIYTVLLQGRQIISTSKISKQ